MGDKEAIRLDDRTKKREGCFKRTVDADLPHRPNLDAVYVEYYPDIPVYKAPIRWVRGILGLAKTVTTDQAFPRDAVKVTTVPSNNSDAPDKVCVIREDIHGNAEYEEHVDEGFETSIAQLQEDATSNARGKNLAEIEGMKEREKSQRKGKKSPKPGFPGVPGSQAGDDDE